MDRSEADALERRQIWTDHHDRQEFEHDLLNRKTTWLLTSQALLFAAYGVTFGKDTIDEVAAYRLDTFRTVVAWTGLTITAAVLVGVIGLINSKRMSWRAYQAFYDREGSPPLPPPFAGKRLPWGVDTRNTPFTLVPDVLVPVVFGGAWGYLLLNGSP